MKSLVCLLVALLVTSVLCDKKPEGRLRARQIAPKPEALRADESKYAAKPEAEQQSSAQQQQYYAPTAPPQELGNQDGDYAELQSYESFRYATQSPDYSQEKYQDTTAAPDYLQQTSLESHAPEQNQQQQQQQYYESDGRSISHSYSPLPKHRHQQPIYQQEVLVGNQHQSVQQKTATQKYVEENSDKNNYYANTPNQLLSYYQNFEIVHPKSKTPDQPISIPIYMPLLTQPQPTKVTYQPDVQYVTSPKHTQAIFSKSTKSSKPSHSTASAASAASSVHQLTASGYLQYPTIDLLTSPAYSGASQQSQYYIAAQPQHTQSQPQYVNHHQQQQQQNLYENSAAAYADIYNTPASLYLQDNTLYEQQPQHHAQQQYYVPRALAEQLMAQILQQAGIHSTSDATQQYIKQDAQEPLQQDLPPQYQAQKFRENGGVTHLVPVPSESDSFSPRPSYSAATSSYSSSSQPKTLLDSYVPSHVIAAQDANRYRERPIKLESGFLPSKINFVRSYKKRKTE